jgi:hypothetical protein
MRHETLQYEIKIHKTRVSKKRSYHFLATKLQCQLYIVRAFSLRPKSSQIVFSFHVFLPMSVRYNFHHSKESTTHSMVYKFFIFRPSCAFFLRIRNSLTSSSSYSSLECVAHLQDRLLRLSREERELFIRFSNSARCFFRISSFTAIWEWEIHRPSVFFFGLIRRSLTHPLGLSSPYT